MAVGNETVEPTGCLGGTARDADMLLAAQAAAPQTTTGAIEVAAAMVRWMQRFPAPTSDEAARVQTAVLSDEAFTPDLVAYLQSTTNLTGGVVEDGRPFYMSTVPGVWLLDAVADDRVTVSIGTAYVIDGALSPTLSSSITLTMLWDDGWHVGAADGTRTTEELFTAGTPFTEGC